MFYIFVDLDLRPLNLKFALLVTTVHGDIATKLEVSTAFLFRENRRHAKDVRTDGQGATFNAAPKGGSHFLLGLRVQDKATIRYDRRD